MKKTFQPLMHLFSAILFITFIFSCQKVDSDLQPTNEANENFIDNGEGGVSFRN